MASFADPRDNRPILELGPGTGVVTAAMIERGIAPERIVAVEFNPTFCNLLVERFAGV
jgi:phosphatidylethanolamine/phosphatidyl-N-methylethanolamine N-methyltransferase